MSCPPLPPFTPETAAHKSRMAKDASNTRDLARVALTYTRDCRWRNRVRDKLKLAIPQLEFRRGA